MEICATYDKSAIPTLGWNDGPFCHHTREVQSYLNLCPSARMGVQAEMRLRRDPAGRIAEAIRSWVEGASQRAGGEALSN